MVNDFREKGLAEVDRVLPSKRIMDLEKDLDLGFMAMEVHIPAIDKTTDCRLGNGGDGLLENGSFVSIEEPNAVAKDIFNVLVLTNGTFDFCLPFGNFRELLFEIPGLDFLNTFG